MAVVATWKNSEFALPLCSPIAMHPVGKPAVADLDPLGCLCVRPFDVICGSCLHEDNEEAGVCDACDSTLKWSFPEGTLEHDGVEDSCVYTTADGWELDISAGTLSKDGDTWEVIGTWNCLCGNRVQNRTPPSGLLSLYCVSPVPAITDCTTSPCSEGAPVVWNLTIEEVSDTGCCAGSNACVRWNKTIPLQYKGLGCGGGSCCWAGRPPETVEVGCNTSATGPATFSLTPVDIGGTGYFVIQISNHLFDVLCGNDIQLYGIPVSEFSCDSENVAVKLSHDSGDACNWPETVVLSPG